MRVLHVITRMIVGGAQENTLHNCVDLRQLHGDDVLLVTGMAGGPEGDLLRQGGAGDLAVRYLPELRRAIYPPDDLRALRSLRSVIREFQPDVVHTHSAKAGFLGRRAAWVEQVPAIVHTVHGAPFHPYQSAVARELFRRCERSAARWCHRLISVADAMTRLMVDAGVAPESKFTTIYSGMDVEPFLAADRLRDSVRREWGFREQDIVIGKVARLFHLKGHDDLIRAASIVAQRYPQAKFLLVGDGILGDSLRRQIADLGMQDRFVFTGLVPPTVVPGLLGAMDVLVHTSLREGLARALPQALIAGRPVVSYDIDGAREVALDGKTGFLVPAGDIATLADRIGQLVADGDVRFRMGQAGRQLFTERFRHESMTAQIRRLYQQVLDPTAAQA